VALHGGRMIVAHYQLGIYDVQLEGESTCWWPCARRWTACWAPPATTSTPTWSAKRCGACAGDFTLHVLRLPDLFPLSETTIPNPDNWGGADWFRGITLEGERLYVAGMDGVTIFDTSTTAPTNWGSCQSGTWKRTCTSRRSRRSSRTGGGCCSPPTSSSGDSTALTAYDLTNPSSPAQIGRSLVLPGETVGRMLVEPGGERLYFSSTIGPDNYLSLVRFDGSALAPLPRG
jgi:hypothetical protein